MQAMMAESTQVYAMEEMESVRYMTDIAKQWVSDAALFF
jgi:hypothetical protein